MYNEYAAFVKGITVGCVISAAIFFFIMLFTEGSKYAGIVPWWCFVIPLAVCSVINGLAILGD